MGHDTTQFLPELILFGKIKVLYGHTSYIKNTVNLTFSIVVDDVDAGEKPEPEPEVSAAKTVQMSTTDSSTRDMKEESDARIKQIQVNQ
jgi:hypothetical protein